MIVTVVNHKGGVGKTTTAVNLAAALGNRQKRVLVVDNDPQSNTTGILTKGIKYPQNTLYELLDPDNTEQFKIEEFIYPTMSRNVWLLPNTEKTNGLEIPLAYSLPDSQFRLRDKIRDYAKQNFDVTFIDCPPTLGLFVANAMNAADAVIVPVDAGSAHSVENLGIVIDMISDIVVQSNVNLRFLRMLINRADRRTIVCSMIEQELRKKYGDDKIFETIITAATAIQQAEYAKNTIFQWSKQSRSAILFRELADEMLGLL